MAPGKENFYPLSFFMAAVWIWFYSLVIVWFTFEITMAFNLHFSIIPLCLYSFGIALRDQKKFQDYSKMIKTFGEKLPQQQLSLAETFSGPIFQMTGLMGVAWLLYMFSKGTAISFLNEGIQFQMPLLLIVSVIKYFTVYLFKFHATRKMFYINIVCYVLFVVAIVLIDYRLEMTGGTS